MDTMTLVYVGACILAAAASIYAVGRVSFLMGHSTGYVEGQFSIMDPAVQRVAAGEEEMTAHLYDMSSRSTWNGAMPGTTWGFVYLQAKLSGEAGEFAEHFGKALRDDPGTLEDFHNGFVKFTPERRKAMLKELGDILWYVTILAKELGSSLVEVMTMNVLKLRDRHARGKMNGSGDNR